MSRLIRAVIDIEALRHNLNVIRARAGRARVIAVVKANAYGHGLVGAALSLRGADAYAVARLEEGLALRAAGLSKRIVLLEGVFTAAQLEDAADERFDLVVHDACQIELLERAGNADRFALWLKIDTGMHRLGFAPTRVRRGPGAHQGAQPRAARAAPDDAPGVRQRARRARHGGAAAALSRMRRAASTTRPVSPTPPACLATVRRAVSGCGRGWRSTALRRSRT